MHGFTTAFAVSVGILAMAAIVVSSLLRVPRERDRDDDRGYVTEGARLPAPVAA